MALSNDQLYKTRRSQFNNINPVESFHFEGDSGTSPEKEEEFEMIQPELLLQLNNSSSQISEQGGCTATTIGFLRRNCICFVAPHAAPQGLLARRTHSWLVLPSKGGPPPRIQTLNPDAASLPRITRPPPVIPTFYGPLWI